MAYFSNGTEGEMYDRQYCDRCIHQAEEESTDECPVKFLHMIDNYDQCGDSDRSKSVKLRLELFIPTGKDSFPEQCKMFIPNGDVEGQTKMF
jgi:hypothetical protein